MVVPPVTRVVRWRRRQVPKVRVTWLGQVLTLLYLCDYYLMQQFPMGMGGKILLTIGVVAIPFVLLCLWRAGLLPPERFEEDVPPRP